jgi:glycosyltransferase involved in cell wall biosynthesis
VRTVRPTLLQINLSPTLGGAEVWTADFSRALSRRGWRNVVVTSRAAFWDTLDLGSAERRVVAAAGDIAALASADAVAIVHASLPADALAAIRARCPLVGVAHQAVYDGRHPAYYAAADPLFAVSRHVIATLQAAGLAGRVHPQPLFGVAQTTRRHAQAELCRGRLCEWDRRKARDRILASLERIGRGFRSEPYARRPGLVLGIVSRIAPLKQFPALFAILAPLIAQRPDVRLEVFGAAIGHRALRELRHSLAPLGDRVRYWGHQDDVAAAYRAIDWLLPGLPEREALGLNLIEAVATGTPVLAVDAPPFTETMTNGITGFLYRDPRADAGADFGRWLDRIRTEGLRPDLANAGASLAPFSFAAFADRADAAMSDVAQSARTVND